MREDIKARIDMINRGEIPEGYEKMKIGIIPKEWKLNILKESVLSLDSGVSVNSDTGIVTKNNYGVLKAGCVINGKFKPKESKLIKEKELTRVKCNPKKGCFIVSRANTPELVGSVGYVDKSYPNLFLSDKLWQIECNKSMDSRWVVNVLSSEKMRREISSLATGTSRSMQNISKEKFLNILIPLPTCSEQNKIIEKLLIWDKYIELKEKLVEAKKEQKKGLEQRLLNGKVRLKGFTQEWENRRLSKILNIRNDKSEVKEELELYSLTIEDGVVPKTDRYNREFLVKEDNKKYKVTKLNDIVYNPANLRFGAIALNKNEKDVLLSPIYETLFIRDTNKYSVEYISKVLTTDGQINKFSSMAEGTLVERMSVKVKDFVGFKIFIPTDIKEQKAIAEIIDTSEKELNILKKELEFLRNQRKGLMQLLLMGMVRV